MAVEQFAADYPGVTLAFVALLVGALIKLVTHHYKLVTQAIKDLTTEVKTGHAETRIHREKDQSQVGLILDRLQKQETLCRTVRSFCPHAHRRSTDVEAFECPEEPKH